VAKVHRGSYCRVGTLALGRSRGDGRHARPVEANLRGIVSPDPCQFA